MDRTKVPTSQSVIRETVLKKIGDLLNPRERGNYVTMISSLTLLLTQ